MVFKKERVKDRRERKKGEGGSRAEGCRNWKRINEGGPTRVPESKYYVRHDSCTRSILPSSGCSRVADGSSRGSVIRDKREIDDAFLAPAIVAFFFFFFFFFLLFSAFARTFKRRTVVEKR